MPSHLEMELPTCHSIGMLLQSYGLEDDAVSFVACHGTHPLERKLMLKLATHTGTPQAALRRIAARIRGALDEVEQMLESQETSA